MSSDQNQGVAGARSQRWLQGASSLLSAGSQWLWHSSAYGLSRPSLPHFHSLSLCVSVRTLSLPLFFLGTLVTWITQVTLILESFTFST